MNNEQLKNIEALIEELREKHNIPDTIGFIVYDKKILSSLPEIMNEIAAFVKDGYRRFEITPVDI